jgi:hypothetical protein
MNLRRLAMIALLRAQAQLLIAQGALSLRLLGSRLSVCEISWHLFSRIGQRNSRLRDYPQIGISWRLK